MAHVYQMRDTQGNKALINNLQKYLLAAVALLLTFDSPVVRGETDTETYDAGTSSGSAVVVPRAAQQCTLCHGAKGHSKDKMVPSIGGFSEFGILDLMESYSSGSRKARTHTLPNGRETDMREIIASLSDEQLNNVSLYFAGQVWRPQPQKFDRALARRGARIHQLKCNKCHTDGGGVPEDDLAIMGGQWRDYLEMEFADFDSGSRRMAKKMQTAYDTLSAEDKRAIIELYVAGGATALGN